ncbi:hypothetical protein F4861DRAFT_17259 [Xylaria intraflava]|nr:hypothetical protein F4861DRAFT_17259 [Xylaria intraflava]
MAVPVAFHAGRHMGFGLIEGPCLLYLAARASAAMRLGGGAEMPWLSGYWCHAGTHYLVSTFLVLPSFPSIPLRSVHYIPYCFFTWRPGKGKKHRGLTQKRRGGKTFGRFTWRCWLLSLSSLTFCSGAVFVLVRLHAIFVHHVVYLDQLGVARSSRGGRILEDDGICWVPLCFPSLVVGVVVVVMLVRQLRGLWP